MSKTIVCTTGTSIAGGPKRDLSEEEYRQKILSRIQEKFNAKEFLRNVSAETNSLRLMNLGENDRVYLMHSDTDDGLICAEFLTEVISEHFSVDTNRIRISGLQVKDLQLFRQTGIPHLIKELDKIRQSCYLPDITFNLTGGFKGTIPLFTLYGMLYKIPSVYLYEFSDQLINVPRIPVEWNEELLEECRPLLKEIDEKCAIDKNNYERLRIQSQNNYWFDCLVEPIDELLSLSPLGMILAEMLKVSDSARIFIHADAITDFEKMSPSEQSLLWKHFKKMRHPELLASKSKSFRHSELKVYKPGNVAERIAYFKIEDDLYICEIFTDHAAYERDLFETKLEHYQNKSDFKLLHLVLNEPETEIEESKSYEDLLSKNAELMKRIASLEKKIQSRPHQDTTFIPSEKKTDVKPGKKNQNFAHNNFQDFLRSLNGSVSEMKALTLKKKLLTISKKKDKIDNNIKHEIKKKIIARPDFKSNIKHSHDYRTEFREVFGVI